MEGLFSNARILLEFRTPNGIAEAQGLDCSVISFDPLEQVKLRYAYVIQCDEEGLLCIVFLRSYQRSKAIAESIPVLKK